MQRRRLTSLLGAATLALGGTGHGIAFGAGLGKGVRRIGWLSLNKAESALALQGRRLVYDAMRRAGYDERANLVVERRYAEEDTSRLAELAEDILRQDVELLIAVGNPAIAAALAVARRMPVVMLGASLPVDLGFVASLARPAANVTGTAWVLPETAPKMAVIAIDKAVVTLRDKMLSRITDPLGPPRDIRRTKAAVENRLPALDINMAVIRTGKLEKMRARRLYIDTAKEMTPVPPRYKNMSPDPTFMKSNDPTL